MTEHRLGQATRVLSLVAGVAVLAYAALVTHDFFSYIGAFPYLAVDESLANVSVALADSGRYGFMASPIQGFTSLTRHDGFFNYGPWYFWLGAALVWLFGYSLELLRSIHLLAIASIAIAAFGWFRGTGRAAPAAVVALALFYCFDVGQWPMVRPDVMVSVFAVAACVAAGVAIGRGGVLWWGAAGAAAACAAFTHLIAWALVPAIAVVMVIAHLPRLRWRSVMLALCALVLGGLAAATMFYGSFGFRIGDHLTTLLGYRGFLLDTAGDQSYADTVARHLNVATAFLTPTGRRQLIAALAFGVVATGALAWKRPDRRASVLAYVMPPLVLLVAYVSSLGSYNNFHIGYSILPQVLTAWVLGAALHVLCDTLPGAPTSRWAAGVIGALLLAVTVLGTASAYGKAVAPSARTLAASRWVPIGEYLSEVSRLIPSGSRAWGSIFFGIQNPSQLQNVQFVEGARLLESAAPEARARLAPEYILWGYPENRDGLFGALQGRSNIFDRLTALFGQGRFSLVALVEGAPYGVTRVYERRAAPPVEQILPVVSAYEPVTGNWRRALGPATPVPTVPAQSVTLAVRFGTGRGDSFTSTRAVQAALQPGTYVLRVRLRTGNEPGAGRAVVALPDPTFSENLNETGLTLDSALYAPGDDEVFLLYRHKGGRLWIGQFDWTSEAAIEDVDAYLVHDFHDFRQDRLDTLLRPIEPLTQWIPETATGVTMSGVDGRIRVNGNDTQWGYQVVSPEIAVPSERVALVRADFDVQAGAVCVGVLTGDGARWLVAPDSARRDYRFQTEDARSVRVVFANCNPSPAPRARSRFLVERVGITTDVQEAFYTDLLVGASEP